MASEDEPETTEDWSDGTIATCCCAGGCGREETKLGEAPSCQGWSREKAGRGKGRKENETMRDAGAW